MKTLLVTGGAGFIGSNFISYFIEANPRCKILNLDRLTYAADLENLRDVENSPNYEFIEGDICDRSLVTNVFMKNEIEGVIHFAAESHVDNSISGPEAFIKTNVMGTFTLLDVARLNWKNKKHRFLHVSTDEVYGTLGETGLFTEETPYAPNSPYSASKAASDMVVRSYFHTYGMNVVTTNCSNNYGPKQHMEKLIPTVIRKALSEQNIPVYGNGKNIRDWLFVLDHCKGIELCFNTGKAGETYNIGGRNEKKNLDIVLEICSLLDTVKPRANGKTYSELIKFVEDRPGHDLRYAIDATKIENTLGWKAEENFKSGILKTVRWYVDQAETR